MQLPRTHEELDQLAAAHGINFPEDAKVPAKQEILAGAGVNPGAAVAYRLVDDPELNYVELGVGQELVRLQPGEGFLTTEPLVILALDAHPLVERVNG